ncbi:mor transcription activator family protein, partial [Neisseria meningitidis]|nr:mor transcription activator family protein [Neisseria meningitidis]MBG8617158.1 mor transcription activator family protein [Neisseria meningitidis]MBG8687442.1 mor transcription activator family protein [Neisseria meningitidis]MBG8784800.1 mor transcription activator family protein [Neisseria meningitidis]MBG8812185.1 mor transcription activator family protein [Neisseria meningitidis]
KYGISSRTGYTIINEMSRPAAQQAALF